VASGPVNVSVTLNTMGTNWATSFAVNGNVIRSATFATNPTITNVVFGTNNVAGSVNNFVLTAVPEPSTYGLLGLAGLAFLLVSRRRK
jgi:hypothetical protein